MIASGGLDRVGGWARIVSEVGFGLFGGLVILFFLGRLAAVPVVGGLAVGYVLVVEGRRARGEPWRESLRLFATSPRLGAFVLGVAPWVLVLSVTEGLARDAAIIDPDSSATQNFYRVAMGITVIVTVHLVIATLRGARLRYYYWPPSSLFWMARWARGRESEALRRRLRAFVDAAAETLDELGTDAARQALRALVAATAWLAPPLALIAFGLNHPPVGLLLVFIGALALVPILGWLPYLLARLTAHRRLRAAFEVGAVRSLVRRAPVTWAFAVLITYVATVPVHLVRFFVRPDEAPTLVATLFVATLLPARFLVGSSYHRATNRPEEAWWPLSAFVRTTMTAALGFYLFWYVLSPFADAAGLAAFTTPPAFGWAR